MFEIGDLVQLKEGGREAPGLFSYDQIYVVGGVFYNPKACETLGVEKNDRGYPDAWLLPEFEPAAGPW